MLLHAFRICSLSLTRDACSTTSSTFMLLNPHNLLNPVLPLAFAAAAPACAEAFLTVPPTVAFGAVGASIETDFCGDKPRRSPASPAFSFPSTEQTLFFGLSSSSNICWLSGTTPLARRASWCHEFRPGLTKFTARLRSANFMVSCFDCSGKNAALAAIFRSLGLNPSSSPESNSVGVGKSDSGRFASVGLRGLRIGMVTGEGESEGSFSAFSSFSGSESVSSVGRGVGTETEREGSLGLR